MAQGQAYTYLSTTGAGIAIGTNIEFGGFIRGSDLAGTITITASAGILFVNSANSSLLLSYPIAINGPVTMTSSAGDHFVIIYRQRLT